MIVSENIKIKIQKPISADKIEEELKKNGLTPLRWAVINVENDIYTISLSYIRKEI